MKLTINLSAVPPNEYLLNPKRTDVPLEKMDLVGTFPPEMHQDGAVPGLLGQAEAFSALISKAKKKLRIASPFMDQGGIRVLSAELQAANQRGVECWILTRVGDLELDKQKKFALKELDGIFGKRLRLRSYCRTAVAGQGERVLEGLHAKLVISDDSAAYLGSGELRINSLTQLFELGTVISGPIVEKVVAAFDAAWDRARAVSYGKRP